MVTGDFNGDGRVDLACSNGQLLLGQGDGTFEFGTAFTSSEGTSITAGDYNSDGKVDVVTAVDLGYVVHFMGNGDGNFTGQTPQPVGDVQMISASAAGRVANSPAPAAAAAAYSATRFARPSFRGTVLRVARSSADTFPLFFMSTLPVAPWLSSQLPASRACRPGTTRNGTLLAAGTNCSC